ncbi:hypothetical protein [Fusobacterium nucleatum]|uniref:Uncharacterized protein n=1 Tax=Fusobacterium nucleatum TaxID=851 RepID=A0A133NET0_FUSNU|nr:hypothetical protein [Fusobacterium nucleatum]KXA14757.1 hypothetical protein HMPREF3221_02282 [Fusobacterium nucleatum]
MKYAVSDTNSYLTQTSSYFIKDDNEALIGIIYSISYGKNKDK